MQRYTQIVCTLGPASSRKEVIQRLSAAGMGIARINFSHSDQKEHQKRISDIRSLNKKLKNPIQILADLEGYRIRLGSFKKKIHLSKDEKFILSNEPYEGGNHIPMSYTDDLKKIRKGYDIYIDDGKVCLRVIKSGGKRLETKVIQEGVLTEHKGVNIPDLKLEANITTKKDKEDLEFAVRNKVENIAQSFVRNRRDIQRVVNLVKPRLPACRVIAKIESREGLRNIDSILDVCDGVMIARGDLGVTLPIYKIPIIQKHIIRHCNRKKKFSITATQMLDSMIENSRPTRAEVSDVANAVLDGTDYVMLSGETAVGKFPVRSVQMMRQIVEYTEQNERVRL